METTHRVFMEDSRRMADLPDQSVALMVTSPPYPMIEMWDALFAAADPAIAEALSISDGESAFECMHRYLDAAWREAYRVLRPGAIACINIGDAARTINGQFRLFPNHARIINSCRRLGFSLLPVILWRKSTNAPNKFMGSGMLPPGAYVTLEHEYILVFRKGAKRDFTTEAQKRVRRQSAYFWEERNAWFSDVWINLPGATQKIVGPRTRERSAAFPLEIPYRLINMFSVKGDLILDPFLGTGKTLLAAMCSGRHSVGYDIDSTLQPIILQSISDVPELSVELASRRISDHIEFIRQRTLTKNDLKHTNRHYGFAVMTAQEEELVLDGVREVSYLSEHRFKTIHAPWPFDASAAVISGQTTAIAQKTRQLTLF